MSIDKSQKGVSFLKEGRVTKVLKSKGGFKHIASLPHKKNKKKFYIFVVN